MGPEPGHARSFGPVPDEPDLRAWLCGASGVLDSFGSFLLRIRGWYAGWTIIAASIWFQAISIGTIWYGFTFWIGPWMREFAVGRAEILLAIACLSLIMGLLSPFAGRALDRMSIRALICAGAIIQAVGFLLIARATALWQIVLIYATLLPGGVVLTGPLVGQTLAVKWFHARRGLATGLAVTGIPVGALLLPHGIVALFTAFGWRTTHLILAGFDILIVALPAWLIIRNTPQDAGIEPEPGSTQSEALDYGLTWTTREILSQRVFWVLGIALLILNMMLVAILQNLGPRAEDLGFPIQQVPFLVSANAVALILSNILFGSLADRWDSRYLYWLAVAVLALGMLMMIGSPSYLMLLGACALLGLAEGCILPVMGVVVSRHFGPTAFGQVAGLVLFLLIGFAMLGPILMGWVRDHSGSYDQALIGGVIALMAAALLMACLPRPRDCAREPSESL